MAPESDTAGSAADRSVTSTAADVIMTGLVIIVPFVLTLYLIDVALRFIGGAVAPFISILDWLGVVRMANFGPLGRVLVRFGLYDTALGFLTELTAFLVLVGLVVGLGLLARSRSGERAVDSIDHLITSLPVVGPVYRSFRRMGDVIVESGIDNFRSVKLVEFPRDGMYAIGFVTNEAPASVATALEAGDPVTLFVPLAPNPVMGGFLVHVAPSRIHDVDMTVEEAARSIITSGIAGGEDPASRRSLDVFQRLRQARAADLSDRLPVDVEDR